MKWLLFLTLVCLYSLVFRRLTRRRRQFQARIWNFTEPGAMTPGPPADKRAVRPLLPFRQIIRRIALKSVRRKSQDSLGKLQLRLYQSGNPLAITVPEWVGLRISLTVIGILMGLGFVWLTQGQLTGFAVLLGCVLLGWIGPEFWLSRKIQFRQAMIIKQLPTTLDLLTVSVEAGLGFDQALAKLGQKLKGPLADEFTRCLREVQLGSRRSDALQRLADRTGMDDVKSFVSAVVQADKLGLGMAQVLRVQSAEVRRRRRMDAEERAMKAPIKMLFPLVMFVFPALFMVILGPALLHMVQVFGHTG